MNPTIELFRGVAAWMVLTSHYAVFFGEEKTILSFLWTGVDFFFVLSGFVFAPTLDDPHFKLKAYFIRRFFRIYPLYVCSLLFYYSFSADHPQKLLFFIKHSVFLQTTTSLAEAFFFNPAYWSLPVEIEYYLFIPFLAWLTKQYPRFPLFLFLGSLALTLFIAIHATELTHPNLYTILSFHLPNILIEFMLGILLYRLYRHYREKKIPLWIHALILISGLSLLGYLNQFFFQYGDAGIHQHLIFKAYFNFFCAMGYAIILLPFLLQITAKKSFFHTFCFIMGNLSYGVYLLHYLVLKWFQHLNPSIKGWTAYLSCAGIVVIITFLLHYSLERPLRNLGRTWSKKW